MTPPTNTSALQVQIDSLGERMDKGFEELKTILRAYEERTRAIEQREAGCQPIITARVDAAWRKLDEHDTRLATKSQQIGNLEKQMARLITMYNMMGWIAGGFGISIIALIWALITGQAQVTFK